MKQAVAVWVRQDLKALCVVEVCWVLAWFGSCAAGMYKDGSDDMPL